MIQEESWLFGAGVTMERIPTENLKQDKKAVRQSGLFANLALLELNPAFLEQAMNDSWSFMTLGDYLASLRPKQLPKNLSTNQLPDIIQREIEAGLGAALMRVLGPNLGDALLPAVGSTAVTHRVKGLASSAAMTWLFDPTVDGISASNDKGGVPLSFLTLLAAANWFAKLNGGDSSSLPATPPSTTQANTDVPTNFNLSALDKFKAGEVVKGISFVDPKDDMIPVDNFVLERDFMTVVRRMEDKLSQSDTEHAAGHAASPEHQVALKVANAQAAQEAKEAALTSTYDPEDVYMASPVPINSRLFPDLHMGWGDAKCTHTKREVLKMRLISLLLNRLGANYQTFAGRNQGELFSVQVTEHSPKLTKPSELIQALMDSGHRIEVVPTSRLTTFGVALCVKEPDNKWTNIPLGVFIESGFEDEDGQMAPAMMPHSGLDMYISGPLAGSRADASPSVLRIQHFIGIEGFCGWKSHESPMIPFSEAVEQGERLSGDRAVRATRLAALYANTLNGLATSLHLPFGGYGVTSVCDDSAAVIQQCLYGKNSIYPMTSIGKFAQRTLRYAQSFRKNLTEQQANHHGVDNNNLKEEIADLCAIVHALKQLPNDINSTPSNSASAASRIFSTIQPRLPFLLNLDAKRVMESILHEEEKERETLQDSRVVLETVRQ